MSICQLAPCKPERKMWRRVVTVLLLVHIAFPQPLTDNDRQSRQLDFGECCPCPDSNIESSFRNQGHWLSNNARNFESGNSGQFSNGFSQAGFDDCPCRFRNTDSEGSSSIFFPSAMRPTGSLSKGMDSKEDPKNLLEPEVGLASSVLETLREATDEEYRDALARDAARARATEDATPEESAQNIVTIILPSAGDENDIKLESLHIQEPRRIHPLGSSLIQMKTPVAKSQNVLGEIFRVPKPKYEGLFHKDNLDMDSGLGASNVQERILDIMNSRNQKLKTKPVSLKSDISVVCEGNLGKDRNLESVSLSERKNELPKRTNALKSSNNPKLMVNMRSNEECNSNTDMKSAASDMKELFSDKPNSGLKLASLTSENRPVVLKNFLKLRDVELVPPGQLIEKLKLSQPSLQLPPLIENMPKLSDLLKNGIKLDFNKNSMWSNAKNDDKSSESDKSKTNIQIIPRDKTITTDILDAMPSTSNIDEVKDNCDTEQKTMKTLPKTVPQVKTMRTEIIDSIPSSFHPTEDNNNIVNDYDLGEEAKSGEDNYCESTENNNGELTSYKMTSSQSESDLSIANVESQENIHPNDQSGANDQGLGTNNCLEKSNAILREDDKASNSDIKTLNSIEEKPRVENLQSNSAENDNDKLSKVLNNNEKSHLSKSLTSIKESILRKIEDRKKTSMLTIRDKSRESNSERLGIENDDLDCDKEPTGNTLSVLSNPFDTDGKREKSSKGLNTVQFEDLQKLSDSLLEKSLMNEKPAPVTGRTECDEDFKMEVNNLQDITDKPMIDLKTASSNQHAREINPLSSDMTSQNNENPGHINSEEDKESACIINTAVGDSSKSLSSGPDVNEMTAEASDPVIGTQWHDPLQLFKDSSLGLPLYQDFVVQPSSLFDGTPNPLKLDLGGALKLPTLDDIRERLANVFGSNDKYSTVENIDCTNENPIMSAEPSTSNFISRSSITPLEDLNLDIFHLKPLTEENSSTLSKIPGLNLKSFKTKVPVPNNLDFKPLRLQSAVGNEGGLLGATLTLGRDATGTPKLFESLGSPLQNLPSLDEIMGIMKPNVENLVNNPLDLGRNMDSIPRISELYNSLRSDTDNTIRALQGKLGSSLGQSSNLITNSPKKPQELIERIADAKEDLDAKLKGLHYDLNDRLSSIHENILDQTGVSLLNPLFQGDSLSSRNIFNNNNHDIHIKRLHIPAPKRLKLEGKKEVLGKTANYKNRPTVERKVNSFVSQRKFKMPASASVPIPKTIEVPKLKSTVDESSFNSENKSKMGPLSSKRKQFRAEHKLDVLPKESSRPFQEKSVLGKQASSFREKKVKVTFGSTTSSPISLVRSQQRSNGNLDGVPAKDFRSNDSGLARRLGLKSRSEPNGSPSEVQPTRMQSPIMLESRNCNHGINSLEDSVNRVPSTNEDRGNTMREALKEQNNSKITKTVDSIRPGSESRSINKSPILPIPSRPKGDDNSFLSKVRDAVKARLSSFDPKKSIGGSEPNACPDMERSATENTDVVVEDNLKENVSYKCRMVCTKS